jgi:hypothetical protein
LQPLVQFHVSAERQPVPPQERLFAKQAEERAMRVAPLGLPRLPFCRIWYKTVSQNP